MSSIKRKLCIVVLLLGISMQGVAQKSLNPKAVIEAFDSTVYRYDGNWEQLDQLADEICKKTNNNPEVLTGMANSFFRHWAISNPSHKDLGFKYINKVIEKHPKYAPAYLIVGNTYMSDQFPDSINAHGYGLAADKDSALLWFQQAINAMPQSPVGYEEYALALAYNMTGSTNRSETPVVTKLQEYEKLNPSYPVYLRAAKILGQNRLWTQAFNCYDRVDKDEMDLEQLKEYAELCGQNYERLDEVTSYGSKKFPSEPLFVRLGMIANRNLADASLSHDDSLNHFNSAKEYWKKLKGLVPNPTEDDYIVAAGAYNGLEEWDKAVECYETLLARGNLRRENLVFSNLISALSKMERWDKAAEAYENRIGLLQSEGKDSIAADQYYYYAVLFFNQYVYTDNLTVEEGIAILERGDSLMSYAQHHFKKFRNITETDIYSLHLNNFYGSIMREYYNRDVVSSDVLTDDGFNFANRYIALEQEKPEGMERPSGLFRAFKYLAYYYYKEDESKSNCLKCIDNCYKLLDMSPDDTMAKNILNTNKIKKYMKYYR